MQTPWTGRLHIDCCHEGKTSKEIRKERTHKFERTGEIPKEILKNTNSGNGRDNKKDIGKWEIVLLYYYQTDNCNGYVLGLTSHHAQHSEEDIEQQEADNNKQASCNMATRRGKQDKKMAEGMSGSNKEQRKRGRKSCCEHTKTLIDAYMAGNPPDIRSQITRWERNLMII